MPGFVDIRIQGQATREQGRLFLLFRVAGEEENVLPVSQQNGDGVVIAAAAYGGRAKDGERGIPQRILLARHGQGPTVTFLGHGVRHVTVGIGVLLLLRHEYGLTIKFIQDNIHPADMVFVRVGADYVFQRLHALLPEIVLDIGALAVVPGIYQHRFPAAEYQGGVSLAHVQEMHRHLLCCFPRFISGAALSPRPPGIFQRPRRTAAADPLHDRLPGDIRPRRASPFHLPAGGGKQQQERRDNGQDESAVFLFPSHIFHYTSSSREASSFA